MQMKNPFKIILYSAVLLLTIGLVGCQSVPIQNVEHATVIVSDQTSLADIKNAIKLAGAGLGWQMKETEPGVITGTLYLRRHMAKVQIPYSKAEYSIRYQDSYELDYDGTNIHSNYNGWIQNLDREIRTRLSLL
jgi:hypothetical protein